ncbi:MAG: hypothetical protein AAFY98_00835 [Verrucomicrobiota bacterium]
MAERKSSRVFESPKGSDAIQRAIDYGIDISLLKANLELSPLERMESHDAHLNEMVDLQERVAKLNG